MYQWLQAIVSGAALVLPQFLSPTGHTSHPLLSKETLEWTESIRIKYNLPGISIGIIASPDRTGGDWQNETHGLGYMDARGRAVDGDVSRVVNLGQRGSADLTRPCLRSHPTLNSLLPCPLVFS
jgi:hypothetical protein